MTGGEVLNVRLGVSFGKIQVFIKCFKEIHYSIFVKKLGNVFLFIVIGIRKWE